MRPQLTPDLISAAARDESNRHARAHGRTVWTREDYNAGIEATDHLWVAYYAAQGITIPANA